MEGALRIVRKGVDGTDKKQTPKKGSETSMRANAKKKNLYAALAVLLTTALLLCVFPPGAIADDETRGPGSSDQIEKAGDSPKYYDLDSDTWETNPIKTIIDEDDKDGMNQAYFNIGKEIRGTEDENLFDVTLSVTSSDGLDHIDIAADAAVILVLDVSGSMLWVPTNHNYRFPEKVDGIPEKSRKLLMMEAVTKFIETYGDDGESPRTKRLLSLVRFGSGAQSWNGPTVTEGKSDDAWVDVADNDEQAFAIKAVGLEDAEWTTDIPGGYSESLYSDFDKTTFKTSNIPMNGKDAFGIYTNPATSGEPNGRWKYPGFFNAYGSTNIEAGLQLAYNMVKEHIGEDNGFNGFYHVVLLTDGQPNGQLDRLAKPTTPSNADNYYKSTSYVLGHIEGNTYLNADGKPVASGTSNSRATGNANAARAQYVAQGRFAEDAYSSNASADGELGKLSSIEITAANVQIQDGLGNAEPLDDLATIHTIAFTTTSWKWLDKGVRSTDPDKHSGYEGIHVNADTENSLTLAFQTIKDQIARMATVFSVQDPMSDYVDLVAVKSGDADFIDVSAIGSGSQKVGRNTISLSSGNSGFDWSVKDSEVVKGAGSLQNPYEYELTYRIRLKADAAGPDAIGHDGKELYRLTNKRTLFSYYFKDESGATPSAKQAEFRIPKVRPNLGTLELLKVNEAGETLPGAVFALERRTEADEWSAPVTVGDADGDGAFRFSGLARGEYRLSESTAPTGYGRTEPYWYFQVRYGKIEAADSSWAGADATQLPGAGEDGKRRIENRVKPPGIAASKSRAGGATEDIPAAGGVARYEVLIENTSASALRGITLTDEIVGYDAGTGYALTAPVTYSAITVISVTSGGAIVSPGYYGVTNDGDNSLTVEFKAGGFELASGAAVRIGYDIHFPANDTGRFVKWTNTAHTVAFSELGDSVEDESSVDTPQLRPENIEDVLLTKTAGNSSYAVGNNVPYTIKVTNTGQDPLKNIRIADDRIEDINGPLAVSLYSGNTKERDLTSGWDYSFNRAAGEIRMGDNFKLLEGQSLTLVYHILYDTPGKKTNNATVTADSENKTGLTDSGSAEVSIAPGDGPEDPDTPITLEKRLGATGGTRFYAGDHVPYVVTITNTGEDTLTGVEITDDKFIGLDASAITIRHNSTTLTAGAGEDYLRSGNKITMAVDLAPGDTLTVRYSVVYDAAGAQPNEATVTAYPKGGDPEEDKVTAKDDETVTVLPDEPARLTVEKSAAGEHFPLGAEVPYTVKVTNSGTETLNEIAIVDNRLVGAGRPPLISKTPGGTLTYIYDYTFDASAGKIALAPNIKLASGDFLTVTYGVTYDKPGERDNEATVTAKSETTGNPVTGEDGTSVYIDPDPNNPPPVTLEKTAGGERFPLGVAVPYTVKVSNTGTAGLTDIVIRDSRLAGYTGALDAAQTANGLRTPLDEGTDYSFDRNAGEITMNFTLLPERSLTIDYDVTYDKAGAKTNKATVTARVVGSDPDDPPVTDEDEKTVQIDPDPDEPTPVTLEKTSDGKSFPLGVAVPYTVVVTNTGDEALREIVIRDGRLADYTGTLEIFRTASGVKTPLNAGTHYSFDRTEGKITMASAFGLPAGQSLTVQYAITYDKAGEKDNKATVTARLEGSDPGDPPVTDEDETTVQIEPGPDTPPVTLEKTSDGERFPLGVLVPYTVKVSNTGNADLTDIVIKDSRLAGYTGNLEISRTGVGLLAPGSGYSFDADAGRIDIVDDLPEGAALTVKYGVTYDKAGEKTNKAIVTARVEGFPDDPVTDEDEKTVQIDPDEPTPVTLEKTSDGKSFPLGVAVPYTVVVANTGDKALREIEVRDGRLAGYTGTLEIFRTASGVKTPLNAGTDYGFDRTEGKITMASAYRLPVGQSLTVKYAITYDKAGEKDNKATVTAKLEGSDPGDPPVTDEDETTVQVEPDPDNPPLVTLEKTSDGKSFPVGMSVPYTVKISNTGDKALTEIVIADARLAGYAGALEMFRTASGTQIPLTEDTDYSFDRTAGTIKMASGFKLPAGQSLTVKYGVVYDAPGTKENRATVTTRVEGSDLDDPPAEDDDGTTVDVGPGEAVTLEKTAGGLRYALGVAVPYTVTITNTGAETLTDIAIADDRLKGLTLGASGMTILRGTVELTAGQHYSLYPDDGRIKMTDGTGPNAVRLAPGETLTVKYGVAYNTIGETSNTAIVTAKGEKSRNDVTTRDDASVNVYNPGGGGGGGGGGDDNNNNDDDDDDDDDDTNNNNDDDDNNNNNNNNGGGNTNNGGGGGGGAPTPGAEGNSLIPGPNGTYVELDENGVPLGEWRYDDDAGEWVFDEYPPPLANLPQTGEAVFRAISSNLWAIPLLSLLWFGLIWPGLRRRRHS
jgi:hypothetical protein